MINLKKTMALRLTILALGLSWQVAAQAADGSNFPPLAKLPVVCVESQLPPKSDIVSPIIPGTATGQKPSYYSVDDWSQIRGGDDREHKVATIYKVANAYNIPPAVLSGSITQESGAAELSVGSDFDNWTCGPSQFSVISWCEWAEAQPRALQSAIGWPVEEVKRYKGTHPGVDICKENSFIAREHVRPFLEVALDRMKKETGAPEWYFLESKYYVSPAPIQFQNIAAILSQISKAHGVFQPGDPMSEHLRYKMSKSFSENCSKHVYAFDAMAFALTKIYLTLPLEVRNAQRLGFQPGTRVNPLYSCQTPVTSNGYPLQVSWLIADAIYNAGPSLWNGIADYQKKSGISWEDFTPQDLIKAINYAISPQFGMWGIGPAEAKGHIQSVVDSVMTPRGDL